MARIRTIKPEFFTSEDIVGMSPLARLFYVSLWCESDREGRFEWKPGTFKMRYFPGDNCDINELANELIAKGLVVLFSANGKNYAEIPTFTEHQVINNRETPSTIPPRVPHASTTRQARVKAEGKEGREGKGKEDTSAEPPFDPLEELKARGVSDQLARDWLKIRKAKRCPLTATGLNEIIAAADTVNMPLSRAVTICCKRGWAGFELQWLSEEDKTAAAPPKKDYL